ASQKETKQLLYAADMNLIPALWQAGNISRVKEVLRETDSKDIGFEWGYWNRQTHSVLTGHTDSVTSASFSPDGFRIVTASADNTARVWNAATGKEMFELVGHSDLLNSASFSPDGLRIVTASRGWTARVWNASTGKAMFELEGYTGYVNSCSFSLDGLRIVTASGDNTVLLWDADFHRY
ncbi:MAG: hypothetical protein JWQ02_1951, partial [Capsulimonas sp.]|nr:hypothetical protein [Capsulimonas sp.]